MIPEYYILLRLCKCLFILLINWVAKLQNETLVNVGM